MQGHVNKISTKQGVGKNGPWTMYNLEIDGTWYGCGFNNPNVPEGSFVEFDVVQKGQYTNANNVRLAQGMSAPQTPQAASTPAAPAQAPRVNSRDVSIQYQSSRKDAIQTLGVLLESEAIKLPAKQADKYDAAMALIEEITAQYYIKLENVIEAGGVELEDAIPAPGNG